MRRCSGFTVAEAIISLGLFALVLVVVGELTVASYRVHTRSTDRATVFRMATAAADRMSRELRLCKAVYAPERPSGGWSWGRRFEAGPNERLLLVFRRAQPATGQDLVLGYRFDGQKRVVDRLVYRNDFDPARPETHVLLEKPRKLADGIDGMAFWPIDPGTRHGAPFAGVEVSMLAEPERVIPGSTATPTPMPGSPIRAEVRVKGL